MVYSTRRVGPACCLFVVEICLLLSVRTKADWKYLDEQFAQQRNVCWQQRGRRNSCHGTKSAGEINSWQNDLHICMLNLKVTTTFKENGTATPTGDAPITSEWSTILLPSQVLLILDVWRYLLIICAYSSYLRHLGLDWSAHPTCSLCHNIFTVMTMNWGLTLLHLNKARNIFRAP